MNLTQHIYNISSFRLAILLSAVAIAATLLAFYYWSMFFLMVIAVIALPLSFSVIVYPKFGVLLLLISSYLIMYVSRLGVNFPVGTLMDGLQLLLCFGFFIAHKLRPRWNIFKNSTSLLIIIWVIYNLLQFFNVEAESKLAWIYSIRAVAMIMLLYFIFMTQIKSISFIRLVFKIWIGLAFVAAAYAFKQEHYGFFQFEKDWLASDPNYGTLYYIAGHWRKFSIFSDPVAFSYNMVTCSILCLSLIFNPIKLYKKIILALLIVFFLVNMVYSGTRAAFVLFPVALCLLAILKFNFKVLIFSSVCFIFLVGLIYAPIYSQNIMRFQSAFKPSNDASFNLRKINQKRIQPYIQTHPFGGGLGSVGTWGARFTPNSYLATVQPDSGYVRVAVESGWVGLLIICTLLFVVLQTGIKNYYSIKDRELKNYCLGMVLIIFALSVGNYPQEAIVQFPTSVYFYLFIALIHVTKMLDDDKQKSNSINNRYGPTSE